MEELDFYKSLSETSPKDYASSLEEKFSRIEDEFRSMKIQYELEPNSDSLIKLYNMQAKGRAYFERASEIYRIYLKLMSKTSFMITLARNKYKQVYSKALSYARENRREDFKMCKSGEERQSLVESFIPDNLVYELAQWELVESLVKTQFSIVKSYKDSFESIRQDVLVQLSTIKQLIALGGLKIDVEAARALNIINSSYNASALNRETIPDDPGYTEGEINL